MRRNDPLPVLDRAKKNFAAARRRGCCAPSVANYVFDDKSIKTVLTRRIKILTSFFVRFHNTHSIIMQSFSFIEAELAMMLKVMLVA